MPSDVRISCHCGNLQGVLRGVSVKSGNRCICYCDDCQTFADYLSTDCGILDANGGTDLFQTSPAHLSFTQGLEHLACIRLTPKGLLRWYADCCRTPIGNTLATNKLPFVGLIHSCMDTEGRILDAVLGPVRARVMAKFARGDLAGRPTYEKFPLSSLPIILGLMLFWRLRGDHKHNPFFDTTTGHPVTTPQVINNDS